MLRRQKTILRLLWDAGGRVSPTVFVKLVFLLRQETDVGRDRSFYDFVPYKRGPFSFMLYWDLGSLCQNGYITHEEDRIALCGRTLDLAEEKSENLPGPIRDAVAGVLARYGSMSERALVRSVYTRYPWFALNSELPERRLASVERPRMARPAVYTTGYEGKSVDAFFNGLLMEGIRGVIDVRANAISRKYGFSGARLCELCKKLGLDYRHVPSLGIPSSSRANLGSFGSYQELLDRYEATTLSECPQELIDLGAAMRRTPSVLVCVEKDVRCCHRSRLAEAVARRTGLEVIHL